MAKDILAKSADELETVLDQIEEVKALLKPLEEKEEQIRADLLARLLTKGLKYVKTTSGLAFGVTDGRTTFKVKKGMEPLAIQWAQENYPGLLSLASAKLNQVVKPMLHPPGFLEHTIGAPFLSVHSTESND